MATRLTDAARAFLGEPHFAVLGTINPDGMPQQSVMWFELRDDTIMMNTSVGRIKERNLRRDARASICVEDRYRFITIAGRVTLDDDHATSQADIYSLARRYNPDFKDGDYPGFATQQRVTILISPETIIENGVG
ncbi:MAG: PPOX class F420-dependent oxidoreductase [Vicinamibacterales bacterium]